MSRPRRGYSDAEVDEAVERDQERRHAERLASGAWEYVEADDGLPGKVLVRITRETEMSVHSELAAESRARQDVRRQQTQQERATSLVLELERAMLSLDTAGRELVRQDVTDLLARLDSAAWDVFAARLREG